MTFKIEIRDQEKLITFGTRYPGQIGKDILAVKVALGIITTTSGQVSAASSSSPSEESPIPLDQQGWFDCATGLGIDIKRASTFDDSLEKALTRYQIENRFLITCYLFQKYGAKSLISSTSSHYSSDTELDEYSQSIAQQLYAMEQLFDSEYGTLREATMAVMHGWKPHTILENIGFNHSKIKFSEGEIVVDVIPEVLYQDFISGILGQTPDMLLESGAASPPPFAFSNSRQKLRDYKLKASSEVDWIKVRRSEITTTSNLPNAILTYGVPYPWGSIDYNIQHDTRSILYSASLRVMALQEELSDNSLIPASERKERMKKFFYPDPFSNPDPFYINDDEIGFFDETPFYLSSEGPLPTEEVSVIQTLEDIALQKVLTFYNKPEIWYFLKDDFEFASTYFGTTTARTLEDSELHTGTFPRVIKLEDIEKTSSYKLLSTKIFNKEKTIERLRQNIEATSIHVFSFPMEFDSPTEYKSFVERKISALNREIEKLRADLELIKNPSPEYKREMFWPISTKNIIDQVPARSLYSWRATDGNPEPLIKFVEYRTPSLRPDQPYQALFILNKRKLDMIINGENLTENLPSSRPTRAAEATDLEIEDQACLDQNTEQSERTYEEYRVHAQKKRREIVRALRERVEARERQPSDGSWNVSEFDLPTAGPFDLDAAFTSVLGLNNISNDKDYTTKVIRLLAEGIDATLGNAMFGDDFEKLDKLIDKQKTGDVSKSVDHIEITLYSLNKRIDQLSKDLAKASTILENEGIQFENGSNFDSENEARLLKVFSSELIEMIDGFNEENKTPKIVSQLDPKDVLIRLVFKKTSTPGLGPSAGKIIDSIYFVPQDDNFVGRFLGIEVQGSRGSPDYVEVYDGRQPELVKIIKRFETLTRARTVNYISNIVEITNPYPSTAGEAIMSFFDDKANACADLFGTDTEKNIAISLVGAYTSGLSVSRKEEEELSETLKSWGKKHFVEPAALWWEKSSKNASASLEDTFDEEQALRSLGKMCTLEDLYEEFIDKVDLLTLLCNYLECVKLPGFALKLPNLHLPPFPKIPILGWYAALIQFLMDNMKQILVRILCTFVRTIIDKLAFPFCEEQLQDFIAAGSSATPLMNEALVAALTNTGIPAGKEPDAKKFFEDASKITTGQELCYLLGGKSLDDAGMEMLKRLVRNNDLSDSLNTSESISNFFGVVGSYIPFEFCQQLSSIETPMGMSCKDASDLLISIRNRLQTGDSTLQDSEIDEAMALADKNLKEHKETMESFSGSSLDAMLPESLKANSNNMILSQMPEVLTNQLKTAADSLFEPARMSYLMNISSFVAGMQSQVQDTPVAGDSEYNDIEVLRLETALEQLKNYSYKLARNTDQDKDRFRNQIKIEEEALRNLASTKKLSFPDGVLKFGSDRLTTYYAKCLRGVYIVDQIMSTWEWLAKYKDSTPEVEELLSYYKDPVLGSTTSEEDVELLGGFVHALMSNFDFHRDPEHNVGRDHGKKNISNNYDLEKILQLGIWSSKDGATEQPATRPYDSLQNAELAILGLPSEEFQLVESPDPTDQKEKDFYDPKRGNISWWHYPLSPECFKENIPFFAPFWNPNTWFTIGSPKASSQINIVDTFQGPDINMGYKDLDKLGDYSPLRSTEIQELIPLTAISLGSSTLRSETDDDNVNRSSSVVFRDSRVEEEDIDDPELAFLAYSTSQRQYWPGIQTAEDDASSRSAILKYSFDNESPWHYNSWIQNFQIDYLIPMAQQMTLYAPTNRDAAEAPGFAPDNGLDIILSSPRLANNRSLKNKTKRLLSHEFLVGARNYLIRSLIFLKDFVKEKKSLQNRAFERFNNPDDIDTSAQYANLSEQQIADARANTGGKPVIYPDDLKVLYEVFEVEKIPVPIENRSRGDRSYHWVHKKYKVDRYEGLVFENDLVETGKEITESNPTPYRLYIEDMKDSFKVVPDSRSTAYAAPAGTYALRPMSSLTDSRPEGIKYMITNEARSTRNPTHRSNGNLVDVTPCNGLAKSDFFNYYYSARTLHPPLKASSPFRGGIDPAQAAQESIEVNHIISLDPNASGKITAYSPTHIGTPTLQQPVAGYDEPEAECKNKVAFWLNAIEEAEEPYVQSTAVLNLAMERVQFLSSTIIEIMNTRPNIVQEKHLAIVKEVLEITNQNRSSKFGHINYSSIPDRPAQSRNLSSGNYNGELLNIDFNASPYTPSIKMVEMLTKEKTQDRYNIVIDSDTFIHQGFRSEQGNYLEYEELPGQPISHHYGKTPGNSIGNEESLLILDRFETPSRKIMKFCDPLPASMVANNDVSPEKGDFSKREAFAKLFRNSLESTLGGDFSAFESTLKGSVFKLNTKSIFSELMSSMQFSAMFLPDYARELDKRLSSRPYIIPGTRCLKNRYGFIESSLLSFDKVILGDMTSEIQQEISKPENSPWNRSFNNLSPFDKALRKIAVKAHIRVCLVEFLLKGAIAYSVWDAESIISEPSILEYIHSKIYHELNVSPSLRDHWPKILESATGIDNKSEALYNVIREEIIKLPAYSRQAFNPGEGHKDFHNWYIYGRTLERYMQPQSEQVQDNFMTPEGLFKRLPVPSDVVTPDNPNASPAGLEFTWKIRDYSGKSFLSEMSSFKRRVTRASVDETVDSGGQTAAGATYFNAHDHVSEFIFEDYVRINGDILDYYTDPTGGILTEGQRGCPPTEEELRKKNLSFMVEEFFQALVSLWYLEGAPNKEILLNPAREIPGSHRLTFPQLAGRSYAWGARATAPETPRKSFWFTKSRHPYPAKPEDIDAGWQIRVEDNEYQNWFNGTIAYERWRVVQATAPYIPPLPDFAYIPYTQEELDEGVADNKRLQICDALIARAVEIQDEAIRLNVSLKVSPNIWWLAQPYPRTLDLDGAPPRGRPWPFALEGWEDKIGYLPLISEINGQKLGTNIWEQIDARLGSKDRAIQDKVRNIFERNYSLDRAIAEGILPRSQMAGYNQYDPALYTDESKPADTMTVFNFGSPPQNGEYFYKGSFRHAINNNQGVSSFTGAIDNGTNNMEKYQRIVISYDYQPPDCLDAANQIEGEEGLYIDSLRALNEPVVISIQELNNLIEKMKDDPDETTLERVLSGSGVSQGIRLTQVLAGDAVDSGSDDLNVNPLINHMWNTPNIARKTVTERAYAISLGDVHSYEALRRKTLQIFMRRVCEGDQSAAHEIGLPFDQSGSTPPAVEDQKEERDLVYAGLGYDPRQEDLEAISTFSGLEGYVVDRLAKKYIDLGLMNNSETYAATIPLVSYEEDICNNIIESGIDFLDTEVMHRMSEKLAEQPEFKYIMEHMFPIRRFMAISSMHSTSILGGYGKLPKLFAPTKAKLGLLANMASTPPSLRPGMESLSQAQHAMDMRNNSPSAPEDPSCLELPPGITGEMMEAFYEELAQLIDEFPARLFRGLANTMDPAYKEMRAHFMNCDIKDLNWKGVNYKGGQDGKLINGLKPDQGPRTKTGKYTPLILGVGADLVYSFENFPYKLPSRFGKMLARLGSYIYSGNLPFIDPSGFFKVPCKEYDESWKENEKWDLGYYGRYGHPISPITALALSTQQLRVDLDKRNSNCPDEEVDLDCEDNS
jgi:hypothetical protein